MNITLESIVLTNFKSIASLKFDFTGKINTISGKNGSGKTTIADAFYWCLFGKSSDQRVVDIATLDTDGKKIDGLQHSVEVKISVKVPHCIAIDEYAFKRVQIDKKGGGITCRYYINGHEKLKKDFDVEVSKLCNEKVFKSVTNPAYFSALKWNEQRDNLMALVDEGKIEMPIEYKEILESLKKDGVTVSERRAELKKQATALKKAIDEENSHIVVLQGQNKEYDTDFSALEQELAGKQAKLSELREAGKAAQAKQKEKNELEIKLQAAIHEQKLAANKEYYDKVNEKSRLNAQYEALNQQIVDSAKRVELIVGEISAYEKELDKMRKEFVEEGEKTISFSENDFTCPTCGRAYDADKIDEIRTTAEQNFNRQKTDKLNRLNKDGVEKVNLVKKKTDEKAAEEAKMQECRNKMSEIKDNPLFTADLSPVTDFPPTAEITSLMKQIEECNCTDDSNNNAAEAIRNEIAEINQKLGIRRVIAENNAKIQDSYKVIEDKSKQLQSVEQQADFMAELQKIYTAGIEQQVNGQFNLVTFKMFEQQVNGELAETCVATHNGIPYPELNTAMKINCGLDIINTICKYNNFYAPIFIDGAESINEIIETESQQIRLVVSNEECLTIKNN